MRQPGAAADRPRPACARRPSGSGWPGWTGPAAGRMRAPTASAFPSPVTMKTTSGADDSTGTVIVTRSTNGSSLASAATARRSRSSSVGCVRERARPCGRPARCPSRTKSSSHVRRAAASYSSRGRPRRRARRGSGAPPRRRLEPVEQRLAREPVVRALVVGRDAALVAPPERGRAPVGLALGGELVRAARRRAAGEHDRPPARAAAASSSATIDATSSASVDDDQLDAVQRHSSPAASSRERSIAA